MEQSIIGRKPEIGRLKSCLSSNRSEFIAVYGRRRVGKTFLIKEFFEGKFTFRMTGKENAKLGGHLVNFSYSMEDYFGKSCNPKTWTEAFRILSKSVEKLKSDGKKIIFIDELPWLDTQKSGFVNALEYFWNEWAFYRSDILLIVCGSATSWMLDNLINARGGLHNRVTHKMLLSPFTLKETELYFQNGGFNYERSEIIDCYMAVGGVAYYLSLFGNDKSVAENIDTLCFTRGGELTDEFDKLYKSLFKRADNHLTVITALGSVAKGMTRKDLMAKAGLVNNGNVTRILKELEMCEFIRSYIPFGKEKKDKLYQLIDQFSLFHLRFIKGGAVFGNNRWLTGIGSGSYNAWSGYAFETVCLHHLDGIVKALGISGMVNTPCSWAYRPPESVKVNENTDEDLRSGAQIDLLIDRADKTITLCEMKYSAGEYEITGEYDKRVQDRIRTFKKVTGTPKSVSVAYITPQGLVDNVYARRVKQVTADRLFEV